MLACQASEYTGCPVMTHFMRKRCESERAPGCWLAHAFHAGCPEICAVTVTLALLVQSAIPATPDFALEVRPLFEKHCFKCHGPEKQKGDLRFDTREGAFKIAPSLVRSEEHTSELQSRGHLVCRLLLEKKKKKKKKYKYDSKQKLSQQYIII